MSKIGDDNDDNLVKHCLTMEVDGTRPK